MSKLDWKHFNDLLEQALKASALSFNEEEWMWLIGCLRSAEEAMTEPQQPKAAPTNKDHLHQIPDNNEPNLVWRERQTVPTNNQTTDQAIDEILLGLFRDVKSNVWKDHCLPPAKKALSQLLANEVRKAETRARLDELEHLRNLTREITAPEAFVTDTGVAQSIRVHTNSLIEHRLLQIKGEIT